MIHFQFMEVFFFLALEAKDLKLGEMGGGEKETC